MGPATFNATNAKLKTRGTDYFTDRSRDMSKRFYNNGIKEERRRNK
jgi:hypothetical protein